MMMRGLRLIPSPRVGQIVCEPVRKAVDPDLAQLEAIAAKLEPKLRRAVFAALEAQAGAVDIKALIVAIETGSTANVFAVLDAISTPGWGSAIEKALIDAVTSAGIVAAANITRITRAEFRFGVLNPQLISWLQTYSFGLITEIDRRTKDAVRNAAIAGMRSGKSPIDTAREIRQVVGLTDRQAKAVANYRKELETFHLKRTAGGWGVGKPIDRVNGRQVLRTGEDGEPMDGIVERRLRDFRFDGRLASALETKKPLDPKTIDKMVDAYARKYLRYRSETIARTEAMRTTNMGVQDSWRQAIDAGKVPDAQVRRRWIVGKDERTCAVCNAIPKLNPKLGVKFRQPFASPKGPIMLPPAHPDCRCTVVLRLFELSQLAA